MRKILFLGDCGPAGPAAGAPAPCLRELLCLLAVAGWQVRTVTPARGGSVTGRLPAACTEAWADARPAWAGGRCAASFPAAQRPSGAWARPWELREWLESGKEMLLHWQPEVVLCGLSGDDGFLETAVPLLARARRQGSRTVLYLDRPVDPRVASKARAVVDHVLVSCPTLAEHVQTVVGFAPVVMPDVSRSAAGLRNLQTSRIDTRLSRCVTMFDPSPTRGGRFFIELASRVAALAPGARFRAVGGDWCRDRWASQGVDAAELDRVEWMPGDRMAGFVLEGAALLLEPLLWSGAPGAAPLEAMRAGVPVLTTRAACLPELVDGHWLQRANHPPQARWQTSAIDLSDTRAWADQVRRLMVGDVEHYERAVLLTLRAVQLHCPDPSVVELLRAFEHLLAPSRSALTAADAASLSALAAYRLQMNDERAALNSQVRAQVRAAPLTQTSTVHDSPYQPLLQRSLEQPAIRDAQAAIHRKEWRYARAVLDTFLCLLPEDLMALGLMVDTAEALGEDELACEYLERLVRLAPGLLTARERLVLMMRLRGEAAGAIEHSFALMEQAPLEPRYLLLNAGMLAAARRFEDAAAVYEACFRRQTGRAADWLQYAAASRALGRRESAAAAARVAVGLAPTLGAAWLAMAEAGIGAHADEAVTAMTTCLRTACLGDEDRCHIHRALGRVLEQLGDWSASFVHHAQANRLRMRTSAFDVSRVEALVDRTCDLFTPRFIDERRRQGYPEETPIFVIGLDPEGVELVGRVLSHHSGVERLHSPPHLGHIARDVMQGAAALCAGCGGRDTAQAGHQDAGPGGRCWQICAARSGSISAASMSSSAVPSAERRSRSSSMRPKVTGCSWA